MPEVNEDKIIDKVLDILKQQGDSLGKTDVGGSIDVNPKMFDSGSHVVVGPLQFSTTFTSPPLVKFTQYGPAVSSDVRIAPAASNYTPFLIQPYVYSWSWESGVVDGFFIGMYALTTPKEMPDTHQLVWEASGKASRYLNPLGEELWSSADKTFSPHYLVEHD